MNIKEISRKEWDKMQKLEFHNVGLDFSIKPVILKKISDKKIKVGIETGWSTEKIRYETKYAVREDDKWWIRYSGSPLNNYVKRL